MLLKYTRELNNQLISLIAYCRGARSGVFKVCYLIIKIEIKSEITGFLL